MKQLFRYAAGRHETAADREVIRRSFEDFRAPDSTSRDHNCISEVERISAGRRRWPAKPNSVSRRTLLKGLRSRAPRVGGLPPLEMR